MTGWSFGVRGERVLHVTATCGERAATVRDYLELLRSGGEPLTGLLADTPFEAAFWEHPAWTRGALDGPFEGVLADAPGLAGLACDRVSFADLFARAGDAPVLAFDNLGGDARLVAPLPGEGAPGDPPGDPPLDYPHLLAFARTAPPAVQHAFWRTVADEVEARLSDEPLWLSTNGMGVAWLHVRIDERPKYVTHAPYRAVP